MRVMVWRSGSVLDHWQRSRQVAHAHAGYLRDESASVTSSEAPGGTNSSLRHANARGQRPIISDPTHRAVTQSSDTEQ